MQIPIEPFHRTIDKKNLKNNSFKIITSFLGRKDYLINWHAFFLKKNINIK